MNEQADKMTGSGRTSGEMTRREFLGECTRFGAGGFILANSASQIRMGPIRPNILVIMADEHNAKVLGSSGNSIVHTPALDRLARRGVCFDNCYCNSPLCVPSRLSFTAGKYASRVGAWNNSCWLPSDDYPSLPRILNRIGYESFLCGKMHFDRTRRYGFTDVGRSMNNSTKTGKGGRRAADNLTPKAGISGRFDDFYTAEDSSVLSHDRNVTAGTVEFLRNRKASDKPFFLLAGYLAPHFPLIVPEQYHQPYIGRVPMPDIPAGHLEGQVRNHKHLRIGFNVDDVPDDIVRKGRELYYGLTQWLDNEVAAVLQTLESSQVAENTVVIYTADHGENMGEHGLWWKNCMYENAAAVPLIVSWPARWRGGQRRTGACSLVDVVKTIAELAGAETPGDWDGDSLLEWLDYPKARWKDMAVSEYYAHNICSGCAMLRVGRYKYVYHTPADESHPAEMELYDLERDPGEFQSLAGDPAHSDRIAEMHAILVAELGEEPNQTELRCRADYAVGYARS